MDTRQGQLKQSATEEDDMITSIPAINSKIWASVVRTGMIVRTPDGTQIEVYGIAEGYDTWTFDNGCRAVTIDYADQVEVLGYFNP
jgi:hypothetical protein